MKVSRPNKHTITTVCHCAANSHKRSDTRLSDCWANAILYLLKISFTVINNNKRYKTTVTEEIIAGENVLRKSLQCFEVQYIYGLRRIRKQAYLMLTYRQDEGDGVETLYG